MDVLYLNVTNKEWFRVSLKTLKDHLFNYDKIYVLQTNQDLAQFEDIIVANSSLFQFLKRNDITQKIMIIEQNMGFLKDTNIENITTTYDLKDNTYIHDHIKPQVINKNELLNLSIDYTQNILTQYFNLTKSIGIKNAPYVVEVIKPLCCTVKSLLTVKPFVLWNDRGFNSLRKYFKL